MLRKLFHKRRRKIRLPHEVLVETLSFIPRRQLHLELSLVDRNFHDVIAAHEPFSLTVHIVSSLEISLRQADDPRDEKKIPPWRRWAQTLRRLVEDYSDDEASWNRNEVWLNYGQHRFTEENFLITLTTRDDLNLPDWLRFSVVQFFRLPSRRLLHFFRSNRHAFTDAAVKITLARRGYSAEICHQLCEIFEGVAYICERQVFDLTRPQRALIDPTSYMIYHYWFDREGRRRCKCKTK